MDESTEERLFGLIEIAERQQSVAQTALEGMMQERLALEQELQGFAESVKKIQENIASFASSSIREIDRTNNGHSIEKPASAATQRAPPGHDLNDVINLVERSETILRSASHLLSGKVLWLGLATVGSLAILWWLASCAVIWWNIGAIERAQAQKVQLQIEIAQLKANRDAWVDAGLESKLRRCGPNKRPCVKINESSGSFGIQNNYRVIDNN